MKKMQMNEFALYFVEDMEFNTLLTWANILAVPHHENYWNDDDEPDKTDELRVAVAEAMEKVGK